MKILKKLIWTKGKRIFLLIGFFIIISIKVVHNATVFSWKKNSESISFSMNNDLFLANYRLNSREGGFKDFNQIIIVPSSF